MDMETLKVAGLCSDAEGQQQWHNSIPETYSAPSHPSAETLYGAEQSLWKVPGMVVPSHTAPWVQNHLCPQFQQAASRTGTSHQEMEE